MPSVASMLSEIDDHGFSDTSTPRKLSFMQEAIWDVEGREPWPFIEAAPVNLTFSGSSGIPTNMPTNFRAVTSLRDTTTGLFLGWIRDDEFEQRIGTAETETGSPSLYYFSANALNLWPVPTSSTTVKMKYLKWSDEITQDTVEADILIPKRFHQIIVWGTLWKLYEMEDDPDTAERYLGHYERGIQQMRAAVWQRQTTRPDSIQMVDEGYYTGQYDWGY